MPKITKQAIESAAIPASGDTWLWCAELPGFGVRVQPSGRKTYVLRYRTRDARRTQRKMVICRCSDAPPDKARGLARDIMFKVASGEDPAAERRPERTSAAVTVAAMFQAHVDNMRAKNKASADEVERVLLLSGNNAADSLGRLRAPAAVTPADVVKFVSTFYRAGHRGAADKARGYIAAAYNWAIKSANDYTVAVRTDWVVAVNPAAAVAKDHGAITVRDRNLDAAELKMLWDDMNAGTAGFGEGVEVCLRTMIACGQRVQETLRMCGNEVDLQAREWHMPAEKTKGKKRDHIVPLPDVIIPYLQRLKDQHGNGPLFVARTGSTQEVLGSISVAHAVRKYVSRRDAKVAAFQPRDLRRTWKSRAHDAGVDRFTRDLIQQHAKNDTGSKVYDRANYLPQVRAAMDKWNSWLTSAVGDPPRVLSLAA